MNETCEFCEIDGQGSHAPRCPITLEAEIARLNALINSPHTNDFLEAVRTEAAHQRERWGTEHDAGKQDTDWLFLIGYLAGKAVHSGTIADDGDFSPRMTERHRERRLHHLITTAAACLNWHAARAGVDDRMRPGIEPPAAESAR